MKLNKRKIEYTVRKRKQGMSFYQIRKEMKVSKRRVYQILQEYKTIGILPVVGRNAGRPAKKIRWIVKEV